MNDLIRVFMQRDGMTKDEAEALVKEMASRVDEGEDPEEILMEENLEPDFVLDLLDYC